MPFVCADRVARAVLAVKTTVDRFERHGFRNLTLLLGVIGLCVGLSRAWWQDPVENAQVLAGIVRYPPGNPMLFYYLKQWSAINQLGALVLKLNGDEALLSFILCGLRGILYFLGLGYLIYAFSRNAFFSALGACVVYQFVRVVPLGVVYNFNDIESANTYGNLGLHFMLLVLGLFLARRDRSAGILLGFAPAVHAFLGAFSWFLVGAGLFLDARDRRVDLSPLGKSFAFGFILCLSSYCVYLIQGSSLRIPDVSSAETTLYLKTFVRLWDYHRQPIPLDKLGTWIALSAIPWGLAACRRDRNRSTAILSLAASTACLLAPISWLPIDWVPGSVLSAMPGRYLNVPIMILICAMTATLWNERRTILAQSGAMIALFLLFAGHKWPGTLHRLCGPDPHIPVSISLIVVYTVTISLLLRNLRKNEPVRIA